MEVYNSDQTPGLSFLGMWEPGDTEKNFSCLSSHQLWELCQRKWETDPSLSVGDKFYSGLWQQRTKWGSFDIPNLIVLQILRKSQLDKIYFQNSNLTETNKNKCKGLWGVTCIYHPASLRSIDTLVTAMRKVHICYTSDNQSNKLGFYANFQRPLTT